MTRSKLRTAREEPATVEYRGHEYDVERGTTIAELVSEVPHEDDPDVFAAMMNNRVVALSSSIVRSGTILLVCW